jgi:osmoprotectant transport system permease protein
MKSTLSHIPTRPILLLALALLPIASLGCRGKKAEDTREIQPGFNHEFNDRPDGYAAVKRAYNFEFDKKPVIMETSQMYESCRNGEVDVICGFSTDGLISAYDLKILEDDQRAWPPYDACPLVRSDTLRRFPQIRPILEQLGGMLDEEKMQELNLQVTQFGGRKKHAQVARQFLESIDMIGPEAPEPVGGSGTVSVGSKEFGESRILGHMLATLLEERTNLTVEREIPLQGSMVAFEALRSGNGIDMYVEYTGTGAVTYLRNEEMTRAGSEEVYQYVKEEFPKAFGLVWLKPLGFVNRYTLTMRRSHAEKFGIETISDLKKLVEGN